MAILSRKWGHLDVEIPNFELKMIIFDENYGTP